MRRGRRRPPRRRPPTSGQRWGMLICGDAIRLIGRPTRASGRSPVGIVSDTGPSCGYLGKRRTSRARRNAAVTSSRAPMRTMRVNTSGCQRNEARHPKVSAGSATSRTPPPRACHDPGDGEPPVAWARLCPEGAHGADDSPRQRGEQRQRDEVEVQVVAMQRGARVDGVADERVDGVALDAVDRGRIARQREIVCGVGQRHHGQVAAREHDDHGAGVGGAAGMELGGLRPGSADIPAHGVARVGVVRPGAHLPRASRGEHGLQPSLRDDAVAVGGDAVVEVHREVAAHVLRGGHEVAGGLDAGPEGRAVGGAQAEPVAVPGRQSVAFRGVEMRRSCGACPTA